MKRIKLICFFISVLSASFLSAQMIIPKFHEPIKVDALCGDADESMVLPFNNAANIYFERTYASGSGNDTRIKRQDIWYSSMGRKGWDKPYRLFRAEYLLGENFIIGTSKDGKRIYLFNTLYTEEGSSSKLIYLDNTGKDEWAEPVEIKIPGLDFGEKYYHFFMDPTEKILLISMSPAIDHLDEDLYVSLKGDDGKWGNIIDLGTTVNTRRFEVSPYIAEDTKTLYFSSSGHGGYGSADIFVTHRLDDSWEKWSKPLNLGEPINSDGLDAYFIMANSTEVFFTSDRESNHINVYKSVATGEFVFANADSIGGQFYFKGLPADRITLRIEDEDGNLIDEIVTDAYGRFHYVKLDKDQNYLIKLAAEDDSEFLGSKIYFVDENGKKTDRYILTEDGVFVNSKDIAATKNVKGVFNYKEEVGANTALEVLDENGFPLDTVITDDSGNFSYGMKKYDGSYSVVPLDIEEGNLKEVELYLVDEKGDKLKTLMFKNNKFVHEEHKLAMKPIAIADNSKKIGVDKEYVKGAEIEVGAWNGMAQGNKVIYFGFGEVEPSQEEKNKLSLLISILKYDENKKVRFIGHTDNYGPKSVNERVGLNRAASLAKYLVSEGIPQDRIETSSEGELSPVAPNYTFEGKAKNRRVEILIQ